MCHFLLCWEGAQLRKQNQQNQNKQRSRKHGTSTEPAGHKGQMTLLHTDTVCLQTISLSAVDLQTPTERSGLLAGLCLWLTNQQLHQFTSSPPQFTGNRAERCSASATPHHQLLQVYASINNVINQQVVNPSPYSTLQLQRSPSRRSH